MNRFEVHDLMDILYSYGDDDVMDYNPWEGGLMNDDFYSRYESQKRNKIVEITETGCDARSPGECTKNTVTNNIKKTQKVPKVRSKDQIPKNPAKKYTPFQEELKKKVKLSKTKSRLNLAVSNSTFVISDRETSRRPTTTFEDFFDDFGAINQRSTEGNYKTSCDEHSYDYHSDGIQNKRKFVDRAVDSDCSSSSSKCAVEKETSGSEIQTELKNKEKKVSDGANDLKNEIKTRRTRTKILNKSSDSANEEIFPANTSWLKSNRSTPEKISSPAKNLKNRQGGQSKSDNLGGRQKVGAASRTISKNKNLKVTKPGSEILKPLKSSLKHDEKNGHVVKKVYFKGSKLPVWQGWHKQPTDPLNLNTAKKRNEINSKEFKDGINVMRNSVENAEEKQSEAVQKTNVNKGEKSTEKNMEENFAKVEGCLSRTKPEDPVEASEDHLVQLKSEDFLETRKKAENIIIENHPDDEEMMKHENTNVKEDVEEHAISAESKQSTEMESKEQSLSELWTENCEKAYARGRAIGLNIDRIIKAAREKRRRKFAIHDFDENNYYKEKYSEIIQTPPIMNQDHALSKLKNQ